MATRTKAEERAERREAYNAYLAECPSHNLLSQISGKWVTLVLSALAGGPLRYSGIARRIPGVSQKMLTQTLRTVERDGLVTRTVTASVPVRVDYELTPLGASLHGLVARVKDWAESNMDAVWRAREEYDRGEPPAPVTALNRRD